MEERYAVAVMAKFAEITMSNKHEDHAASRIKTWKRHYKIVTEMRKESRVGWDEVTCKVVADGDT